MSERKQEIQVGIAFILAVALLVGGVLWFKEFRIGGTTYEIHVDFPTASGLVRGDPVEVQGVSSGKVEAIRYDNGKARVTLRLKKGVTLYPNTRVEIENVGIMGQKLVAVYPGPSDQPPLPSGAVLEGTYQPGIPQLMAGLGGTLGTLDRFASRLDSLLAMFDATQQGQLRRTVANTERLTGDLAALLRQNQENLSRSIRSMSRAMAELDKALANRGERLGTLVDNATSASAHLDSTLTALDRAVRRMDGLVQRVESSQGSVGKALNDEELYENLVTTLKEARALLADLRENPRRYLKVSLF